MLDKGHASPSPALLLLVIRQSTRRFGRERGNRDCFIRDSTTSRSIVSSRFAPDVRSALESIARPTGFRHGCPAQRGPVAQQADS
jgi:hypothetical protein